MADFDCQNASPNLEVMPQVMLEVILERGAAFVVEEEEEVQQLLQGLCEDHRR